MFSEKANVQDVRSDVFYTLVPINRVGRVCGLVPVKLTRNKLDHTSHGQTDFPLLAYGITLALALTAAQCWGMYREHDSDWKNNTRISSRTMLLVTGSDALSVIVVTFLAILGSPSRWKTILQALNKIVQADEQLNFSTTRNIRRSSVILISCTVVYLTCITVVNHVSWDILFAERVKYSDKGPINYLPLYFMYIVIVALEIQYTTILMNLGERFTKLNGIIEELTKINATIEYVRKDMGLAAAQKSRRVISQTFVYGTGSRQRDVSRASSSIEEVIDESGMTESIDQLLKVYDLLCDSIDHLNRAFGVPLVTGTIGCLIHLVITLYSLFVDLNSANSRWWVLIRQLDWVVFHIYSTLLFVQPSHMVASKARNTGSLVSQALARDWNPRTRKHLERFAIQLLQRPVEFTACGLFYLNRGLITSIAGAVTTYLVILLQFQSSSKEDTSTSTLLQNASVLLDNVSRVEGL